MNKTGKNRHEWGVIGQSHNPYFGEILYCPLCRQYKNEDDELLTKREFEALLQNRKVIGNPIYHPDSNNLYPVNNERIK